MSASSREIGRTRDMPVQGRRPIVAYMNQDFFKDLIQGLAPKFRWSRALQCPCNLEDTDQPDPSCALCLGTSWWYRNPDRADERQTSRQYLDLQCAFSSNGMNPDLYKQGGTWFMSDAVLAIQSEARVSFHDKFVGLDQEMTWCERVLRNTASAIVPVGLLGRTTAVQESAMRYAPVRVEHVATKDGTEYFEGTDFVLTQETINEPRKLEWLAGRGPANGARYVVSYICRPVWIVTETTYALEHMKGPDTGILGKIKVQTLPTAFKVRLDYLSEKTGT